MKISELNINDGIFTDDEDEFLQLCDLLTSEGYRHVSYGSYKEYKNWRNIAIVPHTMRVEYREQVMGRLYHAIDFIGGDSLFNEMLNDNVGKPDIKHELRKAILKGYFGIQGATATFLAGKLMKRTQDLIHYHNNTTNVEDLAAEILSRDTTVMTPYFQNHLTNLYTITKK